MSSNIVDGDLTVPPPKPFGEMCFLELPVTDAGRAAKFYTAVLGWKCGEASMPSPTPWVKSVHFFNKGGLNGAFLLMEKSNQIINYDGSKPERVSVLPTFCVASIEETVEKAEKLGGKVHVPKTAIGGGMGFFCRFIDCEGNLVGIWAQE
ncbi:hypothetical protein CkaCkLH20_00174 [Colletotrichum karsti]|uniref:VOC domain-containing protein n=1 Tax=Colletotrichum karsti TaxID=1095194 RepID=A0A9P6IG20_9PEZI|nr:uncharacterized protein CkaCkLH20_00174 [Colletotrichum karsti]KAF9882138.1 hypothetical protein CkaCkLH20_00174 [Colletotrichum karsti]